MQDELTVRAPNKSQSDLSAAVAEDDRAGPASCAEQQLVILFQSEHFLVISKPPDVRMDGEFDVTVEKLVFCCDCRTAAACTTSPDL